MAIIVLASQLAAKLGSQPPKDISHGVTSTE